MFLLQFQITNIDPKENEIAEDFCEWLCDQIFTFINNKRIIRKLKLRWDYCINNKIINTSKETTISDVMEDIYNAMGYNGLNYNIWQIYIDKNYRLKNSLNTVDKFLRFVSYGDQNIKGISLFTRFEDIFSYNRLSRLWQIYSVNRLGHMSNIKMITNR